MKKFDLFVDGLLLLGAFLVCLPVEEAERPAIDGLLISSLAVALFLIAMLAAAVFRHPRVDRTIVVLLALTCSMAVLGPAMGTDEFFEWRNYWADIRVFLGLLTGILWFRSRPRRAIFPLLMTLAVGLTAELGANLFVLRTNVLRGGMDRLASPPMYYSCTYLAVLLPLLNGYYRQLTTRQARRAIACLNLACAALIGYAAFISSTRSLFLEIGFLSVLCSMTMSGRVTKVLFVTCAGLLAFFVSAEAFSIQAASLSDNYLIDRLMGTDLRGELRYFELQMLFDHLRSDSILGLGFGSMFWSPYLGNTLALVTNPHIGAFTFLLKGGLPAFGLLILAPLVLCVRGLSQTVSQPLRFGAWGAVGMYLVVAGLSGGWDFYSLFGVGLAYAMATAAPEEIPPAEPSRIPRPRRTR